MYIYICVCVCVCVCVRDFISVSQLSYKLYNLTYFDRCLLTLRIKTPQRINKEYDVHESNKSVNRSYSREIMDVETVYVIGNFNLDNINYI